MKLLVISPHADDETLGAGGMLLKYKAQGQQIYWLNITDMQVDYNYGENEVAERTQEIQRVIQDYLIDGFYNLGLEPAGLDKYDKQFLVQQIFEVIDQVLPDIVLLPYSYDVHSDHQIVFDAVYACTKVFRCSSIKKILCMEIVSETDFAVADRGFVPNYFVDISDFLEQKIAIMERYKSQIKPVPFPRSAENIRALARVRGASAGVKFAEAFRVVKIIE